MIEILPYTLVQGAGSEVSTPFFEGIQILYSRTSVPLRNSGALTASVRLYSLKCGSVFVALELFAHTHSSQTYKRKL